MAKRLVPQQARSLRQGKCFKESLGVSYTVWGRRHSSSLRGHDIQRWPRVASTFSLKSQWSQQRSRQVSSHAQTYQSYQKRHFSLSHASSFRAVDFLQSEDPDLTESQRTVREAIAKICTDFPDPYWQEVEENKRWPIEFTQAIAKDGWLGICMPEEYGGSNLGLVSILPSRIRPKEPCKGKAGHAEMEESSDKTSPRRRL